MKPINRLLALCLALCMALPLLAKDHDLKVWMDQKLHFTADGQTVTYLTVHQTDPKVNYMAYNMTILLPKGTAIHQVKSGRNYKNDIQMSERATDTHTIACNMPEAGMLKVICTSSMNQDLYPDDEAGNPCDELFTVGLVADASTYNGTYRAEMVGVCFVNSDDKGIPEGAYIDHTEYAEVSVSGGTDFPGVSYTLPRQGVGTLMLPFDCQPPSGLEFYSCQGIDHSTLTLAKVDRAEANTPYIVRGTPGTYQFNGAYCALLDEYSTDYLTGVYVTTQVPEGAYVMQDQPDNGLGFYRVVSYDPVTLSPYRCYLNKLAIAPQALSISWGDDATGMGRVDASQAGERVDVYDTTGKLLRKQVKRADALKGLTTGVYLINNQKVTVK